VQIAVVAVGKNSAISEDMEFDRYNLTVSHRRHSAIVDVLALYLVSCIVRRDVRTHVFTTVFSTWFCNAVVKQFEGINQGCISSDQRG
jgi:hypothetical protein